MTAFNKLLVANFKQFWRDKTAVFFTFAFPLIFIFLFGMVFGGDNMVNYNIGVVQEDSSEIGGHIAEALNNVPIFTVTEGNFEESLAALKAGDLAAVIVIPENVGGTISTGGAAALTLYHDPSQTTTGQVIIPVLRELVNEFNRQFTQAPVVLTLSEESILAANLSFIDFFVPGILAMSIMQSGLFGVLPLVEWREKKVLKRLGVTPLTRGTVVTSQLVFRVALAVVQAGIIIGVAYVAFGVPVLGSWLALIGLVVLGTLLFIALGYVIGARVKTVEGATPIVNLISFPMMFLSGIFWPVEMMPDFIRPVISAMPLTYLGDAFRQVMVESPPLYSMSIDIMVMLGWLAACLFLTVRFFKWE